MNLRENVVVEGLPFLWSTNLTDEGVHEFYELYANQIREPDPPQEPPTKGKVVIRIPCRVAFLEFRDGVCLWTASGNKHHVLYRTNHEWELWSARQQEIQELHEEQSAERAVELQLLEVEDHHLTRKTDDAIKAGAYADAAACVAARMDLRIKSKGINGISCLWLRCPLLPWLVFAQFPTSNYGIEFLRKHDSTPQGFVRFAYWFAAHRRWQADQCAEQTKQIYEEGMTLFQNDAGLYKAASLFWRRLRRYDLAMKICSEAIRRELRDGTKSGFEGRMKRLEKESKRTPKQRPIMNWFEIVKAEVETFFETGNISEAESQQRGLAAVDAFHDLFMRLLDELKIRDNWPEQNRHFNLCPTQNIEQSAKMQIDFTIGVEPTDGWFIEASIACEEQIRHMKDDYWAYITKLASIGKAELQSSYPLEWESSPEIKHLIRCEGSLTFSIARNFTLLALKRDHNFSIGTITVTLPLESDESAVTQFFRDGLDALYRSNYLLHRSAYLEKKRKVHGRTTGAAGV